MTMLEETVQSVPKNARDWAMGCHFMAYSGYVTGMGVVLGPLITWLLKKEEDPFIDEQGKEAVNFNITWMIAMFCCIPLIFILIGLPLIIMLGIFHFVITLIAGLNASNGTHYRYPFSVRFIQ